MKELDATNAFIDVLGKLLHGDEKIRESVQVREAAGALLVDLERGNIKCIRTGPSDF